MKEERIQKWLAARGYGSRRQIENWLREGRLRVNGQVAILGSKITGHERLSLDGKPLRVSPDQDSPLQVLLYHKPIGEICSRHDPEGRRSVFQALPRLKQGRWVNIGRLDLNTTGLLLFTTDGELAHRLMHPSSEIEREYWVRVAGKVTEEQLEALRRGVLLEDGMARCQSVQPLQALNEDDSQYNRYFTMVLTEGRQREVRRLWEAVGCQVSRLKRIRYGNVSLDKALPAGRYRHLEAHEIEKLKQLSRQKTS